MEIDIDTRIEGNSKRIKIDKAFVIKLKGDFRGNVFYRYIGDDETIKQNIINIIETINAYEIYKSKLSDLYNSFNETEKLANIVSDSDVQLGDNLFILFEKLNFSSASRGFILIDDKNQMLEDEGSIDLTDIFWEEIEEAEIGDDIVYDLSKYLPFSWFY